MGYTIHVFMVEKGMEKKGYGNIFKSSNRSLISKGHLKKNNVHVNDKWSTIKWFINYDF
jgi:hypothetical protein